MLDGMIPQRFRSTRPPSQRGHYLVIAAAIALVCLLAPAVSAQQTTAETVQKPPPPAEVPAAPAPIPVSQISSRSDEAAILLQEIRDRPLPDARADSISHRVAASLGHYQRLVELTDSRLTGAVSIRQQTDLERRWFRARNRADQWRSHIGRRAKSIDRDLETLVELREIWEATMVNIAEVESPEEMTDIVRTTLNNIRAEEKRISKHRAQVLTVQHQLLQLEEIIKGALDQIEAAKEVSRHRLYEFDNQPLWHLLIHRPPRAFHPEQLIVAWEETVADLSAFVENYDDWLWIHALAAVVIFAMIMVLRRREKEIGRDDDPELANTARVLSRPISASLVLALALTYFGYRTAPRAVHEISSVLLFVPLLRILPDKVFREFRGMLLNLFGFYVSIRVMDWLPYEAPIRRLFLLALTVLLFVALARFARMYAQMKQEQRGELDPGIARSIMRAAMVLTVVAFVSNIIGNVSLADLVVIAIVLSALWALILYAFYVVIDKIFKISLRTKAASKLRIVRWHSDLVHTRFMTLLKIAAAVVWISVTLKVLQIWPPVYAALGTVLTAEARFGDIGLSLGGVLGFAITIWATFVISRLLRFILAEDVFPRLPMPRGVPHALSIGLHYVLLLVGFLLAVAATGADLGKFTLLAGAFGVGIGFGLQNIVNNFISGLILIAERPVMPGDTIEVSGMVGDVKRIGARSSTIRTWQGAEVIVPNANLISNEVTNWTLSDRQRRLDIPVGVAYGSPVDKVMQILHDVGEANPDIMDKPEPNVLFMGFGNSSLDFELRVWTTKFESYMRVKSAIIVEIEKALNDAGIVIPFPQRDLHLKTVTTGAGDGLRGGGPDQGAGS
jgi:small-conductance mechanosensitive channel